MSTVSKRKQEKSLPTKPKAGAAPPRSKFIAGGIENFYSYLGDDGKDQTRDYPNYNEVLIPLTSRILVVGPSGSGKTNITMNLIKKIGVFNRIYLFAKTPDEPLYNNWISKLRSLEQKHKQKILYVSDNLADMPAPEDFDPEFNNLLIVDDFVFANAKALEPVLDNWIRARKKNVTMVFISQSYSKTPYDIRKNSNFLIIKRLNTTKDVGRILAEYNLGDIDKKELKRIYNRCTEGDFKNFLTIDCSSTDNNLRFRKNFTPIDTSRLGRSEE